MLDLKESHQVVCFKEHQANKASVQLLVALDLVLKLTALVPVELLFIHRECQPFYHSGEIVVQG